MPVLHLEMGTRTNLLCSQRPILVKCSLNSDSVYGSRALVSHYLPSHTALHTEVPACMRYIKVTNPLPLILSDMACLGDKDIMLFLSNF